MSLLGVTDLRVSFRHGMASSGPYGARSAFARGRTLGIAGESGNGKTVCTQALLGLTPGADIGGSAMFNFPVETGEDLARPADVLRDRAEPGPGRSGKRLRTQI